MLVNKYITTEQIEQRDISFDNLFQSNIEETKRHMDLIEGKYEDSPPPIPRLQNKILFSKEFS